MPTMVQVTACEYDVQEMKALDPETKQPVMLRVLILADPVEGIPRHYIFPEGAANEIGKMLQGEKPADLVVAQPGDIPAPGPNGKPPGAAQPPPTAGRGRPHR